jgi:hypothetical protein
MPQPSEAFRRRGSVDDHSDAIGCAPPGCAVPAPLTPGLCRRSPPAGDRWHRPQPVAAARFTAVLPRGSGGSHRRSPPEPAGGPGHGGRIGVRGSGDLGDGRREPGGPVWPLEVPVRDAVAHRLRPVGISAQARSVTAGAGLGFRVPGTCIGRPSPNQHRRAPISVKGKLAALFPSGPLTVGAVVCSEFVEGQGEVLASQPGCARSLCRAVFWCGQACSDEPGLKAGDGAVLEDQLAAVARDLLGWPVIER